MNSENERSKAASLAAEYNKQGYVVQLYPTPDRIPFSLGGYQPDLLAEKEGEHLLIEIKNQTVPVSINRLQDVAEIVSKQPGWRFLFVNTGSESENTNLPQEPLAWSSIASRISQAKRLREVGEAEAAILLFWSALEALLRRHAESVGLPLEQLSVRALLDYLYSEADLSFEHYDEAKKLLVSRNQLAHGFPLPEATQQALQLQELVEDLSNDWLPARQVA